MNRDPMVVVLFLSVRTQDEQGLNPYLLLGIKIRSVLLLPWFSSVLIFQKKLTIGLVSIFWANKTDSAKPKRTEFKDTEQPHVRSWSSIHLA